MSWKFTATVAFLNACVATVAKAEEIAADDLAFFESKIRPALIEHCHECHSEDAGKQKGGLWLDRRAGWAIGGDSGPAAVPRDVEGSLLIRTIRYEDPDLEMPPDGKLPDHLVADFEEWVRRGLPDPRTETGPKRDESGMSVEEGRDFWSFRPRRSEFGDKKQIDDFVGDKLAEAGLTPLAAATPEQRLRRAKVDLIGFIPTVEELEEFLSEPTGEKWEEMIDRWLASDEFGERWGRHWLDIVRYADSSGGGRAMPFPEAWRFRDYVIDSFRKDRPLDELVLTHIAGDLLPYEDLKQRQEHLIATGFLVLGPHNYENQNKDELNMEIVDEQLDTIGRAFLGQTIGCARCHDHKFDPIPTKDYYAMAGIFTSTHSVTHANVSKWHIEPIPPTAEAHQAIARFEEEQEEVENRIAMLKETLAEMGRGTGGEMRSVPAEALPGIVIDNTDAVLVGEWQDSTHSGRWIGAGYIHDRNEFRSQKSVAFETSLPEAGRYELRVSYSAGPSRNSRTPVEVTLGGTTEIVTINQKLEPEHDGLFQTVGIYVAARNATARVRIGNASEENGHVIVDAVQWLPVSENGGGPTEEENQVKRLERALTDAEKELKKLKSAAPDIPLAMSVVDKAPDAIGDTELRIRGVEGSKGEPVPRGFLEVASWDKTRIPETSSGRLEFARWLTDPRHPLTARVLANRIWQKLMGEGIVPSPDNFGATGEAPTHPELLDYLAERLVASGWSTKALVREILLSQAYSRSTEGSAGKAGEIDPRNRLYWRAHLRSLDVEAMRDSMLALAGTLHDEAGGPSLPPNFQSEFGYEFTTMRRSVYVPVFRNTGYEMFTVFDFANPNFTVGERSQSTIPTQSLFLTNSEFVRLRSGEAASELLQLPAAGDRERVEVAFRRTLGRDPREEELMLAMNFLRDSGDPDTADDADAWTALQRALFGSLDFRFLR